MVAYLRFKQSKTVMQIGTGNEVKENLSATTTPENKI